MTKRIKFTATWSNGASLTRKSDRKEYTHAWRITYRRGPLPANSNPAAYPEGSIGERTGFASSEAKAHAAARSEFASLSPKRGKHLRAMQGYARSYELLTTEVVAAIRENWK